MKRRMTRYMGLFLLIVCFFTQKGMTQIAANDAVYANIIFHFTKYIDWPENRKKGDFVIGVIGNSPFSGELNKIIKNKYAGNQKIVIRHFSDTQSGYDCHILFIEETYSNSVRKIATRTAKASILIVGQEEGTAERGACIDFSIIDERLKLEINTNNIEQRQLSIAKELLQLAIVVK